MFDAHADGKPFAFQRKAFVGQRLVERPRRVAARQHQGVGGVFLASRGSDGHDSSFLAHNTNDLLTEKHKGAARYELTADRGDDCRKNVGANVRFGVVKDARGCAVIDEAVEDPADAWFVDSGGQLAVRVCPGAAFAEDDVAIGVKTSPRPQPFDIGVPLLHGFPLFKHRAGQTPFEQAQRAKQPCRSGANDHHPRLRGRRQGPLGLLRYPRCGASSKQTVLVGGVRFEDGPVLDDDAVFLAGVDAFLEDAVKPQRTAPALRRQGGKLCLGLTGDQIELKDEEDHGFLEYQVLGKSASHRVNITRVILTRYFYPGIFP